MDIDTNEQLIAFCQEALRIPSYSGQEQGVAELMKRKMEEYGFDEVIIDRFGSVLGTINGKRPGKTVLMDGHIDTVDVIDAPQWEHDPFGGEIADGKIYGRGASDMKGSDCAMVMAAGRFAARTKKDFAGTICVSGSVHEECFEGVAPREITKRQVEDQGRGCPVDWNEKEGRYNWELVFCEMYAGGKYDPTGENYEFSLGLNGLGSCATQYASRYMDVTVCRDGNEYKLHFQRGEIVGQMEVTPLTRKKTGTTIRWLPDLEVFTDIDIPLDYYQDVMKRQAVVNAGVTFRLRSEVSAGRFETQDFLYENGIRDYLAELAGDDPITRPVCWEAERQGRDRADKPEYKVKLNIAWCFSNRVHLMEHYHNSSFLEHGGSPDKATRLAFVAALDKYLRDNNKYTKGESKITFPDVQECLLLVSSNFSTQTSYENQTKKAITNKFIQDAMSEFLRQQLQVYFIENHDAAERMAAQVLINKRSNS